MISCRGEKGMVACGCGIAEGLNCKGRRGGSSGQHPGDLPTGTARGTGMTEADTERTAMDRC